jgi:hypothetical protein
MAVNTTMRTRINDNVGSRPLKYPHQCRAEQRQRSVTFFGLARMPDYRPGVRPSRRVDVALTFRVVGSRSTCPARPTTPTATLLDRLVRAIGSYGTRDEMCRCSGWIRFERAKRGQRRDG